MLQRSLYVVVYRHKNDKNNKRYLCDMCNIERGGHERVGDCGNELVCNSYSVLDMSTRIQPEYYDNTIHEPVITIK